MRFCSSEKLARQLVTLLFATLLSNAASGQTLARKGWAGSGITVEPWWQGAVLYQVDPLGVQDSPNDGFGGLRGSTQRLDYLQSLGVDGAVLSPFELQAEFRKSGAGAPFDPKYGGEEDLDRLVQEASRRKIRIFVDLPLDSSRTVPELEGEARFWLSRGIAGLRLTSPQGVAGSLSAVQVADRVHQLQKLCTTYAGQRVLFWDLPQPVPAAAAPRVSTRHRAPAAVPVDTPELVVDNRLASMPRLDAADLRNALATDSAQHAAGDPAPVPFSDGNGLVRSFNRYGDGAHDLEIAKILATALLTSHGAPLLSSGQEIGMASTPGAAANHADSTPTPWVALEDADKDSLLNWYRRMSTLHHENAAVHSGLMTLIAETNPDIVAWVRQAPSAITTSAPVLVVCNVTARRLLVSVGADVRRIGVQTGGGMMRTLAWTKLSTTSLDATARQPDPVSMNSIELPPFGIYIGELPRQPGLESAPSPLRRSSRGARTPP